MKRILQIGLSLLLICLFGCATIGGGVVENLSVVPQGKGLVLFSTGADKTNMSFGTSLTLVEGASLKRYDKVVINIDSPFSSSNFPNEHGHVRTLALPEGEYYLMPSAVNPYEVMTKAPVYRFKIMNGHITYIGNFHLSATRSLSWADSKYKRDVDYFLQKNPNLSGSHIDVQRVEVASDVSQFKTKGIIWGAP
jgi:hypothetical protein